ncbi:MAG: protein kinase [Myxococcota bacterium]|nr:protein kinase [Myxococcota bacterium]
MKTGDIVRDDQGRAFQIGQILGRGLWGKTYSVREEHGPEWALKVPLSQDDLPEHASHLAPLCQEILLEQARLLTDNRLPFLLPIDSLITTTDGTPGLLMPRQPLNLERRLSGGYSMDELLDLCQDLAEAVRDLGRLLSGHGNLTPTNVLMTEQGRIMLSDPLTPLAAKHIQDLRAAAGSKARPALAYLPPEVRSGGVATGSAADTYAVGMVLYWGTLASGEVPARIPETPLSGLDKASLVALKDRVHNRLKDEGANPRFHTRLSDRMAAFLNRALSEKTAPSPPYRFLDIAEFHSRLENLRALTNPSVEHVGKILLDRPPGSDSFTTDEDVVFSCTIGCSAGVETHEEIACGLAVFDREKDERIRDLNCAYTVDRHPSGRHRFGFRLSDLAPGSYTIRVAFKIRESSAEPQVAEGRFERRAAPGYVPPRPKPTRQPIPLERPEADPVTQNRTAPGIQMPAPTTPTPENAGTPGSAGIPGSAGPTLSIPPPPVRQPPPRVATPGVDPVTGGSSTPRRVVPVITGHSANADGSARQTDSKAAAMTMPEGSPRRMPDARGNSPKSSSEQYDQPVIENNASWSPEIPVPRSTPGISDDGEDLYPPLTPDDDTDDYYEADSGPIGEAITRFLDLLRGDAYVMFIGGAAVIMILLIILLFALN